MVISLTSSAQTLPVFSDLGNETWYYLRFRRGGAVVQDMGEGEQALTKTINKGQPSQLWKLVGTPESFELVSQDGRYLYYNSDSWSNDGRFKTASGKKGKFTMVSSTSAYTPAWEIQTLQTPGKSLNQWGGYGSDYELGAWDAGDVNNPLAFVLEEDFGGINHRPASVDEYIYKPHLDYRPEHKQTLWYTLPVTAQHCDDPWMDYALPIGNGQLGAMVFGGIRREMVQFNEKTLWEGSSDERGAYQSFGYLYMDDLTDMFSATSAEKPVRNYFRNLDLETATANASWTSPDEEVTYTREYIASNPDRCIAIHLKASAPGCISQHIFLYNQHENGAVYADGEGMFCGVLAKLSYCARLKVIPTGGTMKTRDDGIYVENADEVLVLLTAATDFSPTILGYVDTSMDLKAETKARVQNAAELGWEELYSRHEADYQALFGRVNFEINGSVNDYPTNVLLNLYNKNYNKAKFRMLEELYFHYGRYLLIASSRGVDMPNNLQGIWNHSNSPAWQCDMHGNINVQMNYWPAEVTNLSETHDAFLNYIYNMAMVQPQWRSYVKDRCGQTEGWVCFTENNLFGHCTWWHNDYCEANAWDCSHLWQHYRYTLDRDFLQHKALPVMISCCRFWLQRLVKASDGTYECPNEWSPEHGPSENATAHSQQIVWDLFNTTLQGIDIIGAEEAGADNAFMEKMNQVFPLLDKGLHRETYYGNFGSPRYGVEYGDEILREWKYTDFVSGNGGESNHRHLSHLMALYPLNNIPNSSEYFQPAVRALRLRGLQSQGWSMGWKMNLYARALSGEDCAELFKLAFRHSSDYVINMSSEAGGVYYNLFDSHSPFQIDGNFGVCAGMAEMLLQSHTDTLQLLPALPAIWKSGMMTGLKAVGNFEVDQYWEDMELQKVVIRSGSGRDCHVNYPNIALASVTDEFGRPVGFSKSGNDVIHFPTTVGGRYIILAGGVTDKVDVPRQSDIMIGFNGRQVSVQGIQVRQMSVYSTNGIRVATSTAPVITMPQTKGVYVDKVLTEQGDTMVKVIAM